MKTGTLKRNGLLNGVTIKSTDVVPRVSWMSVHKRSLLAAVQYERECRIYKTDVDQDELKRLINGPTVHLEAHTLTNGLVTATIHDARGEWICDEREYAGIIPKANVASTAARAPRAEPDSCCREEYAPVTKMARMASNAILGSGFLLRYISGDPEEGSIYSRIIKYYSPAPGKEISLEYSIKHHADTVIELLELQCRVTVPYRTERLIIDADGLARANQVLINGKEDGKTNAVPRLESNAKRVVTNIARAVALEADFTLEDMGKWRPFITLRELAGKLLRPHSQAA